MMYLIVLTRVNHALCTLSTTGLHNLVKEQQTFRRAELEQINNNINQTFTMIINNKIKATVDAAYNSILLYSDTKTAELTALVDNIIIRMTRAKVPAADIKQADNHELEIPLSTYRKDINQYLRGFIEYLESEIHTAGTNIKSVISQYVYNTLREQGKRMGTFQAKNKSKALRLLGFDKVRSLSQCKLCFLPDLHNIISKMISLNYEAVYKIIKLTRAVSKRIADYHSLKLLDKNHSDIINIIIKNTSMFIVSKIGSLEKPMLDQIWVTLHISLSAYVKNIVYQTMQFFECIDFVVKAQASGYWN